MDIFDDDDLLAIANDSASDAESSSESSSVAIGALQTGNVDEYKSDVNTTSKDSPADEEEDSDDEDDGFLENWLSDSKKHENDVQDVTGRAEGHSSQDGSVASNIELDLVKSKAAVESDSSASTPVEDTNASSGEVTESKE